MDPSNESQALAGAAHAKKRSAEELESDLTKRAKAETNLSSPHNLGRLRTPEAESKYRSEIRLCLGGRVSLLYYELEWSKADLDAANKRHKEEISDLTFELQTNRQWEIFDLEQEAEELRRAQLNYQRRYCAAVYENERLAKEMEALKQQHTAADKKATKEIETLKGELVRAKAEISKEENRKLFWIRAHKSQAENFRENRHLVGLPPSDGQLGHDP